MEKEFKDGEHKLIWQKIENLEDLLNNHIVSRLNRLDKRFWWIIGLIVGGILLNKLL